jgi:hypothetical protein
LIKNRWRQTCQFPPGHTRNKRTRIDNTSTARVEEENSVHEDEPKQQLTLLFRRNNPDYASRNYYCDIQFLNSSTLLGVNNHGHFDIIGISNGAKEGVMNEGKLCGKLLSDGIQVSVTDERSSATNLQVYGFRNGSKFVVGMPSGDAEIFSTERAVPSFHPTESFYPPAYTLWSCLPLVVTQHIGPRRRFLMNRKYSLQKMLCLTDYEALLKESNDHSTFNEISSWRENCLGLERSESSFCRRCKSAWAFREEGLGSSSALVGACIDPEMDSFSIRMFDERNKDVENRPTVLVDTTPALKPSEEKAKLICFTSDYGLVLSCENIGTFHQTHSNILKYYDLRMLKKVKSMVMTFPRDNVAGIPCINEFMIEKSTPIPNGENPSDCAYLRHFDRTKTIDIGRQWSCRPHSPKLSAPVVPLGIDKLTGSKSSSNCFVASLYLSGVSPSHDSTLHHVLINSTRSEVVKQVGAASGQHHNRACFSSSLDFMACWRNEQSNDDMHKRSFLSIYDITRNMIDLSEQDPTKRCFTSVHKNDHSSIGTLAMDLSDMYGLQSDAKCMAMDDFGSSVAIGTIDGDIYIL